MRIEPVITERYVVGPAGLDARALANELMDKQDLSGEMGAATSLPGGYRFNITRAGGVSQITYDRGTGKTHIRQTDTGFLGVMNRLHHFHGALHRPGLAHDGPRHQRDRHHDHPGRCNGEELLRVHASDIATS